jgi:hypothetical protein
MNVSQLFGAKSRLIRGGHMFCRLLLDFAICRWVVRHLT